MLFYYSAKECRNKTKISQDKFVDANTGQSQNDSWVWLINIQLLQKWTHASSLKGILKKKS